MRKMIINRHSRLDASPPKLTISRGANLGGLTEPHSFKHIDYSGVDLGATADTQAKVKALHAIIEGLKGTIDILTAHIDNSPALSVNQPRIRDYTPLGDAENEWGDPGPDPFTKEHDIRDELRKYGRVSGGNDLGELYDLELVDTDGDSCNWQTSEPSNYLVYSRGLRQLGVGIGSRWWLLCNQSLRREAITRGDTARIDQYTKNLEPYRLGGYCG